MQVKFKDEAEYQAAVDAAIEAAVAGIREAHAKEIAALNESLAKAREQNATADYSAYAAFPDLVELLKKTDLRPGALPSLCALQVWSGKRKASEIAAIIQTTPKLGDKGGLPATPKMITSALQKLEKSLLTANTGIGIKVSSIRGAEGNSDVKRIRFVPMQEIADEGETENAETTADAAPTAAPEGEQQAA